MMVYRLGKAKYSNDLSGKGAKEAGGRWNSKGTPMVYTSESRALCTTEIAVHTPLNCLPDGYELISIEVPDNLPILELAAENLPHDWKSFPHPVSTQRIGEAFINEGKYTVMKAPSVIVQGEYNYLLNPAHKDFDKIKIIKKEPFVFDKRLFER
jgi:RES domain-containing protein